jgi:nucleoside phosphorylase
MTAVHLLTALPCEAKPIVDHFRLKRQMTETAFAIYSNENICLTVSGIGKSAMAAATAYTHLLFGKQSNSVWLNVGVAGKKIATIGSPFLAEKISDADSGLSHYPTFVNKPACDSAPLITFSKPQNNYPKNSLCDMEASAFFETACRFSSSELIQSLKIISDNKEQGIDKIDPKQVSALIENQLPLIVTVMESFRELARSLPTTLDEIPPLFSNRWHFTSSEQRQLKELLQRWKLLSPNQPIEETDLPETHNRKELLRWLKEQVDSFPLVMKAEEK